VEFKFNVLFLLLASFQTALFADWTSLSGYSWLKNLDENEKRVLSRLDQRCPTSPVNCKIAKCWSDLLDCTKIGIAHLSKHCPFQFQTLAKMLGNVPLQR